MPWCPKCGSEYKEGIDRCRTCDRDLVSEPSEPVADAEGAPDTGIAPLPEAMVGSAASCASGLWSGARLFLLALVRIPRAGRLVGLLAILALLQVPSSRSGAGVYFSWFWPPLEGPRLAALGAWIAYLAALEVFELVGWLVLGGAARAALENLQFGQWIPIAALAVVSTFLAGWLALAICGAFMEIVLRSQNQASAADPINESLAATAGS